MKRVFALMKVLIKCQELDKPKDKKGHRAYTIFGACALLFVMLPCCLLVGGLSYFLTLNLVAAGGNYEGLLAILLFMSICSFVLGFYVVCDALYFTSDLDHLLPLPFKVWEIAAAKFFQTFLAESVMEFMIIMSALIGYMCAEGWSIVGVIGGAIGIITLPIVPLLYCGIIALSIMYFAKWINSKKTLGRTTRILLLIILGVMGLSLKQSGIFNLDAYTNQLLENNQLGNKLISGIFFQNQLLADAISKQSIWGILLYLLMNAGGIFIFLGLSNKLYLKGLYRLRSMASEKKYHDKRKKEDRKQKSPKLAYFIKEIKVLTRTTTYFTNCIAINGIWPVLVITLALWAGKNEQLALLFTSSYHQYALSKVVALFANILVAVLITGMNGLAASAFTREGMHVAFIKYIPLSYREQVMVKKAISLLFSGVSTLICSVSISLLFKLTILEAICLLVISGCGVNMITDLGLILDSSHPKLIWEDELNALRGNLNVFFCMAFAILIGLGLCGGSMLFYAVLQVQNIVVYIVVIMLLLIISMISHRSMLKRTISNIEMLLDQKG